MSDEGRAYVKRHSPFKNGTFWFHYIMGDIANEHHGYDLYGRDSELIRQWPVLTLRVIQTARTALIEGGYLEVVKNPGAGRPGRYRFLFKGFPEEAQGQQIVDLRSTNEENAAKDTDLLLTEGLTEDTRDDEKSKGKGKDYRFEDVWVLYPKRRGLRVGKALALAQWRKLTYHDKQLAFAAVKTYASTEPELPRDFHRWLRDKGWEDWAGVKGREPPRAGNEFANGVPADFFDQAAQ